MILIDETPAADYLELSRENIKKAFKDALKYKETTFEKTGESLYELKEHIEFSKMPEFVYPIVVEIKNEKVVVMDSRSYFNAHGEGTKAREYESAKNLALMILAFETNIRDFTGITPTMSITFATWVSAAIKQIYSLDPSKSEVLRVLLSFYYTQKMLNKSSKDCLDYTAKYLVDIIKLPPEFIYNALGNVVADKEQTTLENLFKSFAIKQELRNFKVNEQLMREVLVRFSWFGDRANDLVALAIDYPPALTLMVAASAGSSVYKKTKIGTAVDSLRKNRKTNFDLVRSLTKELLADYGA